MDIIVLDYYDYYYIYIDISFDILSQAIVQLPVVSHCLFCAYFILFLHTTFPQSSGLRQQVPTVDILVFWKAKIDLTDTN